MIPVPAVLAIAGAIAGAATAWQIQAWRYGARESAHAASQAQAQRDATQEARRIEQARARNIQEAQNEATNRNRKLRADADSARAESERLRDDLAAIARALPGATDTARAEYAAAQRDVLAQCAGAYQELAGKADGHASDAALMQHAWPR